MALPHFMLPATIRNRLQHMSKRGLFLVILLSAGVVAGLVSAIYALTVPDRATKRPVRIAVVAPFSGRDAALGESLRKGVELFIDNANKTNGIGGHRVSLLAIDDGGDPDKARAAAEQAAAADDVIGVVGHWSGEAAKAAAEVYAKRGLPALTPAAAPKEELTGDPWLFRTTFDETVEARFLANYVRNVVGEKTVSIISTGSPRDQALSTAFDEVLQRFGTKVLYRWQYDPASPNLTADLTTIVADITDKKLIGTVLVLGDTDGSAAVLAALRSGNVRNKVVGLRNLATTAFVASLPRQWKGTASVQSALNGTMVTAPMLFDTAGELAQGFRNGYLEKFGAGFSPDWLAGYAYDGARMLADAFRGVPPRDRLGPEGRKLTRDRLAGINHLDKAFAGINGPMYFDAVGMSTSPVLAGPFDGGELVSTLTQLSPIREEGVANYLDELMAGRALYVNDRFMYKTNVVYTGVHVDKVTTLDVKANTADIDFTMWFRWHGNFEPQDVVFLNAVAPIKLEKPDREGLDGDMQYRAYHAHGKFFLNYSNAVRAYGNQLVGLSFRHRLLSRNNLMYVSDVLGMDLASTGNTAEQLRKRRAAADAAEEGPPSLMSRLAGSLTRSTNDPLVDILNRGRVLTAVPGWAIDRAWVSQELAPQGSEGDPAFVGFGKPLPWFSTVDMGMIVKPDVISPRDIFPSESFIYIAIFSLVGAVLARLLDGKERGQFWRAQTLALRIITWPLLLVAVGTLALDYALVNFATSAIDIMLFIYRALWWLVPAHLTSISAERFLWVPIEARTQRKIPNIVRLASRAIIYALAICGIIAFVMNQTLTSLLATSGVLAMIIGLAIQANISNIFAGMVLNIERPFSIGDFVKINNLVGQIKDITWRTVRIRCQGYMVSLPNAKCSEAEVHNYSTAKRVYNMLAVYVDAIHDPDRVQKLIEDCVSHLPDLLPTEDGEPSAYFAGVEQQFGRWVARYNVMISVEHRGKLKFGTQAAWASIWTTLNDAGIVWHETPTPEGALYMPAPHAVA